LFSLFKYPNERVKERLQRNFKNKAVAINELTDRKITVEEAKEAFYKGFEKGLNIVLEPYTLSSEELEYVNEIARTKYETDEWNFRR
jgi:lipoate-protein ligase A